jgi:peptidoglycan hydrolase CwlO-like protein
MMRVNFMKKMIALVFVVLLVFSMFGCTQPPAVDEKITNEADAQKAISDVGSDLGGISNTLEDIDSQLVEES